MFASVPFRSASLALLLAALGCGGGSDADGSTAPLTCSPGEPLDCACANSQTGVQLCADDGASVGPCNCDRSPPGTGGTGGIEDPTGTGGVSSTGGFANTGGVSSTTGGAPSTGGISGTGGTAGTGGSSTSCCPNGDCLCHGPVPTEQSASVNGSYNVQSYTDGFSDKPGYLAATIYYPTDAEPPLAGVVICPGWTATQSSVAGWGPFLASHGIVLMTIDTNATNDSVVQRSVALRDALESLKEENTRAGSPLQGKLSDRFGFMGWSMGGGATWINGADHPHLIRTGIALAGHSNTAGGASIAEGTIVPSMMLAGATDPAWLGGGGQSQAVYEVIPATTPKILYEMASEGHFSWGTPLTTNSGALGRYALSFQKVFLEGDERYRPLLLVEGPGASDWRSTVQ
jgi:dienelactone hydrolase